MKRLTELPEVIAAIVTIVGTFLFSVILGYLEGRIGLASVAALAAFLALGLLLYLLYRRVGPRMTAVAGALIVLFGFGLLVTLVRPIQRWPDGETATLAPQTSTSSGAVASRTVQAAATFTPVAPPPSAQTTVVPSPTSAVAVPTALSTYALPPSMVSSSDEEFVLPIAAVVGVAYDGTALWELGYGKLIRLDPVEGQSRFRAGEVVAFPAVDSLAWDSARHMYWAIRGREVSEGSDVLLIDHAGVEQGSYSLPATFDGNATFVACDGESLWITSDTGTLHRLKAPAAPGELQWVDSFAVGVGSFPDRPATGIAWDGESLWLLDDAEIGKLDAAGKVMCRLKLPSTQRLLWWNWQSAAWDGQDLWVANTGANILYRVNRQMCR